MSLLASFGPVFFKHPENTRALVNQGLALVVNLAKASKMVPVMAGSLFLGNAKYNFMDFFDAALIVAGFQRGAWRLPLTLYS